MVSSEDRSTISGWWHNELGTRLDLQANEDGSVTGWIDSEVGGVTGVHPIVGFVSPSVGRRGVIGFVVSWGETRSMTTWAGHYDLEAGVITTNWLLTAADFDANEWQSTRVGHDTYHRGNSGVDGSMAEEAVVAVSVPPSSV